MYIFIEFNTKFTTLIFKFFSDNYNTCWVWSLSSWAAWEWPCQRPCASPCTWRKIMWIQIDQDINYLSSAALKQALQVKMDTQKNNKGKVTRSAASRTNCLKFLTWIYSSKWKDAQPNTPIYCTRGISWQNYKSSKVGDWAVPEQDTLQLVVRSS